VVLSSPTHTLPMQNPTYRLLMQNAIATLKDVQDLDDEDEEAMDDNEILDEE
jgi:hypothetical protein